MLYIYQDWKLRLGSGEQPTDNRLKKAWRLKDEIIKRLMKERNVYSNQTGAYIEHGTEFFGVTFFSLNQGLTYVSMKFSFSMKDFLKHQQEAKQESNGISEDRVTDRLYQEYSHLIK